MKYIYIYILFVHTCTYHYIYIYLSLSLSLSLSPPSLLHEFSYNVRAALIGSARNLEMPQQEISQKEMAFIMCP